MPAFNPSFIYEERRSLRGGEWRAPVKGLSSWVSLEELVVEISPWGTDPGTTSVGSGGPLHWSHVNGGAWLCLTQLCT